MTVATLSSCIGASSAEAFQDAPDVVKLQAVWMMEQDLAGNDRVLAVVLRIKPGYHLGANIDQIDEAHKETTYPTSIKFSCDDEGIKSKPASFPQAARIMFGNDLMPGFEREVVLYLPITVARDVKEGKHAATVTVEYQACDDSNCLFPTEVEHKVELKIVADVAKVKASEQQELFKRWKDEQKEKGQGQRVPQEEIGKSKTPPQGPPWVRDFIAAQRIALKTGRPIFLYSTKTYCPHCVVMERELLANPVLEPYYDQVVWLYVYRDFTRDEADRAAERILTRFSLSSWPQHLLIAPESLDVLADTGRKPDTFDRAVKQSSVQLASDMSAAEQMAELEHRLAEFESAPEVTEALELMKEDDVVARYVAANYLKSVGKLEIALPFISEMLNEPNDPLRYVALDIIKVTGDDRALEQVMQLVKDPASTRNVHVLRGHAIEALAICGDERAVSLLAPLAKGSPLVVTTRQATLGLQQLATRHPELGDEVVKALLEAFPEPGGERPQYNTGQARAVHQALEAVTGKTVPFPPQYDAASRSALLKSWGSL